MLSFEQEHYSLVSVKQSAQWKVAGDTGEHTLYVVDTSGCTLANAGGLGGDKSVFPKKDSYHKYFPNDLIPYHLSSNYSNIS